MPAPEGMLKCVSRHPLQELVVDTFVANDFCISDGDGDAWNTVVVCTGANACGKVSNT